MERKNYHNMTWGQVARLLKSAVEINRTQVREAVEASILPLIPKGGECLVSMSNRTYQSDNLSPNSSLYIDEFIEKFGEELVLDNDNIIFGHGNPHCRGEGFRLVRK